MRDSISTRNETGFRRMTGQPPSRHLRQSSEDDNIKSKSPLPGPPAGMLKIRIRNPYGSDNSFISEQNNLTTPADIEGEEELLPKASLRICIKRPKEVRFHYGVPLKPNVNSPFPCICLNYYRPEACRGSNRVQEKWTTAECRRFARNILKMRDREEQAVSPTVQPISKTSVTMKSPVTFSQKYNERPRKSKIIPNETPLHSIPNEIEKSEQNSPVPSTLSSLLPQLLSPEDSLQAIDRNNCRSSSTVQNFTYENQNDEAENVDEEMCKEEVVETFSHVDEAVEAQNKRLMNQENMKRYENSTNSFTDGKTDEKSSPSLSTYQTYMEKPDHHQQNSQKFNQNQSVIPEIEEIELCKPNQEYELRDYMNSNATTMNQVNVPVLEFFGAVDVETHTIHQITRYNFQHVSDIEDEAENLSQNSVKQKRIGNVPIKKSESKPNMKLILLRTRSKTLLDAARSGRQRDNSVILIDEAGISQNTSNLSILPPAKKQRLSRFEDKKTNGCMKQLSKSLHKPSIGTFITNRNTRQNISSIEFQTTSAAKNSALHRITRSAKNKHFKREVIQLDDESFSTNANTQPPTTCLRNLELQIKSSPSNENSRFSAKKETKDCVYKSNALKLTSTKKCATSIKIRTSSQLHFSVQNSAKNRIRCIMEKKVCSDETIDTRSICDQILDLLKDKEITQEAFAGKVLGRSQGTVSDLLRNPKPWKDLKAGRETLTRMRNFLKLSQHDRLFLLTMSKEAAANVCGLPPPKCVKKEPKKRLIFSDAQKTALEQFFERKERPKRNEMERIGKELGLEIETIVNYFTNKRRITKRNRTTGIDYQTEDEEN